MAKKKHIHRRIWLDPSNPDVMSWVSYQKPSCAPDGEMDIQIADCFRNITLSLNHKKDQRKIEKLIKFLQEAVEIHVRLRDAQS